METKYGVAYGHYESSLPQKSFMLLLQLIGIACVLWLLFSSGTKSVDDLVGASLHPGDAVRRYLLAAGICIYVIRVAFTSLYLLKRKMSWQEAWTIGLWIIVIDAAIALLGGTNAEPLGAWAYLGLALYVVGSTFNTGSEWMRDAWKRRPENKGKLYTEGFFRYTRHPNYFGDTTLFTGLALLTGNAWAGVIPVLMAGGFIFLNIPALDGYLAEKYGEQFASYAQKTKKFIPFVY